MKTKRFLFFTGGSDSTLLLSLMLKLMVKNKTDELVILMYSSDQLASGQEAKLQQAFQILTANVVEGGYHKNKGLVNRISVLPINHNIVNNQPTVDVTGKTKHGEEFELSFKTATHDKEFVPCVKSLAMQEVLLVSTIPQIVPYLGACKNIFYMGCCGTDIATRNTERLKLIFDTYFQAANFASESNAFEKELKKAGIPTYGRTGGVYMNPAWIPTLEFPLQDQQKKDIILMLEANKNTSYVIDKVENVVEHYSVKDPIVYAKTSVYHQENMRLDYPEDFPSFGEFLTTGNLPGKTVEEVNEMVAAEGMGFMMRAFGIK